MSGQRDPVTTITKRTATLIPHPSKIGQLCAKFLRIKVSTFLCFGISWQVDVQNVRTVVVLCFRVLVAYRKTRRDSLKRLCLVFGLRTHAVPCKLFSLVRFFVQHAWNEFCYACCLAGNGRCRHARLSFSQCVVYCIRLGARDDLVGRATQFADEVAAVKDGLEGMEALQQACDVSCQRHTCDVLEYVRTSSGDFASHSALHTETANNAIIYSPVVDAIVVLRSPAL